MHGDSLRSPRPVLNPVTLDQAFTPGAGGDRGNEVETVRELHVVSMKIFTTKVDQCDLKVRGSKVNGDGTSIAE